MSSRPRIALLKSRRLAFQLDDTHDGGTIHVVKLLQALSRSGCEVDAFTRNEGSGDPDPTEILPGVRLWQVPFSRSDTDDLFARDFMEGQSFVRGVLACPGFAAACFDAILIHHWTSGVAIEESLPEAMPLLFTPHLLPSEKALSSGLPLLPAVAEVERGLLIRADKTIALSLAEEHSCLSLGGRCVQRIPNGVSDAFFTLPLRKPPAVGASVKLGSIGRLCVQKGTDVLVDALKRLVEGGVDASLDVVGPSYGEATFEARLRKKLLDPMLEGRVRLLGPVPHGALPDLVSKWDVYVQPSRYESQGIALLEAMASGCPIVATALPAINEFLDESMAHVVASPPVSEAVAEAVVEAVTCPDWESRAESARQAARAFRWDESISQLLSCITTSIRCSAWQKSCGTDRDRSDRRVNACVRRIVREEPAAEILLLGSTARNRSKPGSDIDLLVFSDTLQVPQNEWHFSDEAPIDVHREPTATILAMSEMSDADLAAAIARRPLVDHLSEARSLTPLRPDLAEAIALVIERRLSGEFRNFVADEMLARAAETFEKGAVYAERVLPLDSQLRVNAGAQLLLQAALVRMGWVVHGAKRRLELAVPYARSSAAVRAAASFLTAAVGIEGVTCAHARKIMAARMQMRSEHLSCVKELAVPSADIEVVRRHSRNAVNYYAPAISDGYLKGCINHVRALSGVPFMPRAYVRWLNLHADAPANSFFECSKIPERIKTLWLEVMEPQDGDCLSRLAAFGVGLARSNERG